METPTFMAATYSGANVGLGLGAAMGGAWPPFQESRPAADEFIKQLAHVQQKKAGAPAQAIQPIKQQELQVNKKRLVRVVMVDAHKDVPPEISLIYDSKEVFTDKTDQELYFDMPVAQLLNEHNEKRTKIVNKDVKDRTEYLEPARISNLQMLVITLATF